MVACRESANCVGGRVLFESAKCQMTIHTSGVMSYKAESNSTEKDFVFGLSCHSYHEYDIHSNAYIKDHNDRKISGMVDIVSCQKVCSQLAWCLSADVNGNSCYLAGVDSNYVTVSSHNNPRHISSSKKCVG